MKTRGHTARAGSYLPEKHMTGPSTGRLMVFGGSTLNGRIVALRMPVDHLCTVADNLSTAIWPINGVL
jgi:hypothetical protein